MRTYEYQNGRVFPGITTMQDKRHGTVVCLGDQETRPKKIALDKKSPAVIGRSGKIEDAWPKSIDFENKRGTFTVLAKPIRGDQKLLVRVNTSTQSARLFIKNDHANGEWSIKSGNPIVVAQADGKRVNTGVIYCDDIVVMCPGDSIFIKPEGETITHTIQNDHGRMRFTPGKKHESEIVAEDDDNGIDGNVMTPEEMKEFMAAIPESAEAV